MTAVSIEPPTATSSTTTAETEPLRVVGDGVGVLETVAALVGFGGLLVRR